MDKDRMFAGCSLTGSSKNQTEMVISTTEADFIGLSKGLRIAILVMNLIEE